MRKDILDETSNALLRLLARTMDDLGDLRRKLGVTSADTSAWRPISTMPDGKKVLYAEKVFGSDKYFEPEIIYRNGTWYFMPDRSRLPNPTEYAVWRDVPTPAEEGVAK